MLQSMMRETVPLSTVLIVLTLVTVFFLGWAIRVVGRREYVLDQ